MPQVCRSVEHGRTNERNGLLRAARSGRRIGVRANPRETLSLCQALEVSLEVVSGDPQLVSHVQPVRRCAVLSYSGIQVQTFTPETLSFLPQPVHQPVGVPNTSLTGQRGDVVDVYIKPPRQGGYLAKSGDGYRRHLSVPEDSDESVADRAQLGVDDVDNCGGAAPSRPQRQHRLSGESGGAVGYLAHVDHDWIVVVKIDSSGLAAVNAVSRLLGLRLQRCEGGTDGVMECVGVGSSAGAEVDTVGE